MTSHYFSPCQSSLQKATIYILDHLSEEGFQTLTRRVMEGANLDNSVLYQNGNNPRFCLMGLAVPDDALELVKDKMRFTTGRLQDLKKRIFKGRINQKAIYQPFDDAMVQLNSDEVKAIIKQTVADYISPSNTQEEATNV